MDKHHPKKWERKKRIDHTPIRGTLAHNKIEDWLVENLGLPKRQRETFSKKELKIILKDLRKPLLDRVIQPQVKRAFTNFLKYWKQTRELYDIKPLYVEQKVYSQFAVGEVLGDKKIYPYAGTVDLLATIKVNGERQIAWIDWKSGAYYREEDYPLQLSAYRRATLEMVRLKKIHLPKLPLYPFNICVLLGGSQVEEHKSKQNFEGWVNRYIKYQKPKKECDGKNCVFCQDIIRCPFISNTRKSKIFKRLGYIPKNPHIILQREKNIIGNI